MKFLKIFFTQEEGLGTVEIVILIAILVIVALIFKERIIDFVNTLLDKVLNVDNITNEINQGN